MLKINYIFLVRIISAKVLLVDNILTNYCINNYTNNTSYDI